MKLIIQIPCFNEENTLPITLSNLPRSVKDIDIIETLVIDDGSSDRTVEVAHDFGVNHIVELGHHQGLASAFRVGLDESLRLGADIIVNTDGDNQYCGSDIESPIHPIIYNKVDLVVGSRDISNIPYFSWIKKKIQKIGSWFVRSIANSIIVDTTSGFRAYSRKAAMQTIVHSRFSYTLETVIQAGFSQLRVDTIPVRTNEKLRESRLASSSWTYLKKSIPTILRIYTMYNPLKVFFLLGLISLMIGFLLGIRYLYFFIIEMSNGHIQSLILASIMIIIGVQVIFIGLVSDLIAANRRLNEEVLYRIKKLELDKK